MNMLSKKSTDSDGDQPPQDYNNRTCYEYGETGHIGKYFPKWPIIWKPNPKQLHLVEETQQPIKKQSRMGKFT